MCIRDTVTAWHITVSLVKPSQNRVTILFVSYFCQLSNLNEIYVSIIQLITGLKSEVMILEQEIFLLEHTWIYIFPLKLRANFPLFTHHHQIINARNHTG